MADRQQNKQPIKHSVHKTLKESAKKSILEQDKNTYDRTEFPRCKL
jgi:hypothetical protein